MINDPYVYPGTDVLINKFGIKDKTQISDLEKFLYDEALFDIVPAGKFNLQHLQAIHKSIFGQLYDWAGKIRTVDISKGTSLFCRQEYIVSEAQKLFDNLKNKDLYLKTLKNKDKFISKFAGYYSEVNVIHPFREGNGRSTRLFFEQLAKYNGYKLDLSSISKEEWLKASIETYNCNNSRLEEILEKSLTKELEKHIKLKI